MDVIVYSTAQLACDNFDIRLEVGYGQGGGVRNVNNVDLKGQYFSNEINASTKLRRQIKDWTTLW